MASINPLRVANMTIKRVVENPVAISKQVNGVTFSLHPYLANSVMSDNFPEYLGTKEEFLDLVISKLDLTALDSSMVVHLPADNFISNIVHNTTADLVARKDFTGFVTVMALKGERLPADKVRIGVTKVKGKYVVSSLKTKVKGQLVVSVKAMFENENYSGEEMKNYSDEEMKLQYEWEKYHSYLERVQMVFK
jgi:hypothetical protein